MMSYKHRCIGISAMVLFALQGSVVAAQTDMLKAIEQVGIATVGDQPFYPVTATLPSSLPAIEGETHSTATGYEFEFLATPDGAVTGLDAFVMQNGQRVGRCQPVPVRLAGPPPRTIYMFPCGPAGGGTLSVPSLVVEFNLDGTNPATGEAVPFAITVQEIIGGTTAAPLQLPINLPGAVTQ